jgi:hypothetical protein
VLPEQSQDAIPRAALVSDKPGTVHDSEKHWRAIRRELNANRADFGDLAADLRAPLRRTLFRSRIWRPSLVRAGLLVRFEGRAHT